MNGDKAHIGFRIDHELLEKFRYICGYEGRSMVGQMVYMIRCLVLDFEKQHGEIRFEE